MLGVLFARHTLPDYASRVPCDNGIRRDVTGDNGACCHDRRWPHMDARQNDGAIADPDVTMDARRPAKGVILADPCGVSHDRPHLMHVVVASPNYSDRIRDQYAVPDNAVHLHGAMLANVYSSADRQSLWS